MKKLMIMSASVIALGAMAQEVSVPPPVVAAETTVAVPADSAPVAAPVPVPVVPVPAVPVAAAAEALVEIQPGALCKTYMLNLTKYGDPLSEEIVEKLNGAFSVDQAYDIGSAKFDAKTIAAHKFNVAVWEGVFEAKKPGKYIFTVSVGPYIRNNYNYGFKINDVEVWGKTQKSVVVELRKGINQIKVVRFLFSNSELNNEVGVAPEFKSFKIDYRLAASSKPAKPVTPSMLKHIVQDEEEW